MCHFKMYKVTLNWMTATHLKKTKGSKKKQLEEHFVTNWVKWQQVSKMMGYKKNK